LTAGAAEDMTDSLRVDQNAIERVYSNDQNPVNDQRPLIDVESWNSVFMIDTKRYS